MRFINTLLMAFPLLLFSLINNTINAFVMNVKPKQKIRPVLYERSTFLIDIVMHKIQKTSTCLRGLDFEAIENEEECDFGTDPNVIPDNCIELPIPNESIEALQVVSTCMSYLQTNDEPKQNSGLEVCYNFSSDSCRASNGGSLEDFLRYANNPVFQSMVNCHEWGVLNVGSEIPGTNTRGAMKTVLIKVVQKKVEGQMRNDRRFLWTLMKERRPPRQGCFLIRECIAVDNAFALTE